MILGFDVILAWYHVLIEALLRPNCNIYPRFVQIKPRAVFLWSNSVVIGISMHREAARTPSIVCWGWGEGQKHTFIDFS